MHVLMMTQRVDAEHDILGFTVDWIETLAEYVDRLDVLTGYAGTYELPKNVHVRSYGKERDFPKSRRIFAFERHCARYARAGVDAVFVHMIPQYVVASWPWFAVTDIPYVLWYAHGNVDWKLRVAHRLVDAVVTPTRESFRLPSQKLHVIGHGIDTDRFSPGPPRSNRSLLLGVGRIDPVKRFETLVNAVDILVERDRDVHLRIVGEPSSDGEYYEHLTTKVDERGLANNVTFVGTLPHGEMIEEYRRAGIFISASQTGSLDKTELEAMACGTPAVSCNDSYVEMVRDVGLDASTLTFPEDDAASLADRIDAILDMDAEAYEALCRDSRVVARERHDITALMAEIVAICEQIAEV